MDRVSWFHIYRHLHHQCKSACGIIRGAFRSTIDLVLSSSGCLRKCGCLLMYPLLSCIPCIFHQSLNIRNKLFYQRYGQCEYCIFYCDEITLICNIPSKIRTLKLVPVLILKKAQLVGDVLFPSNPSMLLQSSVIMYCFMYAARKNSFFTNLVVNQSFHCHCIETVDLD